MPQHFNSVRLLITSFKVYFFHQILEQLVLEVLKTGYGEFTFLFLLSQVQYVSFDVHIWSQPHCSKKEPDFLQTVPMFPSFSELYKTVGLPILVPIVGIFKGHNTRIQVQYNKQYNNDASWIFCYSMMCSTVFITFIVQSIKLITGDPLLILFFLLCSGQVCGRQFGVETVFSLRFCHLVQYCSFFMNPHMNCCFYSEHSHP